jgi:hypothetical protein
MSSISISVVSSYSPVSSGSGKVVAVMGGGWAAHFFQRSIQTCFSSNALPKAGSFDLPPNLPVRRRLRASVEHAGNRADALSACRAAGLSARVLLRHFFEAFGDELIDAFSRLRGLFGDAAMKLRAMRNESVPE